MEDSRQASVLLQGSCSVVGRGLPDHKRLPLKENMSFRTIFILVIAGFCLFCGGLVLDSGALRVLHSPAADTSVAPSPSGSKGVILLQQTTNVQTPGTAAEPNAPAAQPAPQLQPTGEDFSAIGGAAVDVNVPVGSVDRAGGDKYQLVLDSKGAAIRTATFSEFDDRTSETPRPLTFLSPVGSNGQRVLSMANGEFTLMDQGRRLRLDRLDWKSLGVQKLDDGGESASFEATIVDSRDQPVMKLTKIYRVHPGTYLLDITFNVENLSAQEHKVQYVMTGPVGLEPEGLRSEVRKVIAGFRNPDGQVVSTRLDMRTLAKATSSEQRILQPRNANAAFLWAAAVNKYFAAIMVPMPADSQESADWIAAKWGTYFNPDQDRKGNTGDETIGLAMSSVPVALGAAGQPDSAKTYDFKLYLGPKDKSQFDKNPMYKQLGFVQTIDFQGCCCPASIINPLTFGILAIMKWMYGFIGNYGVVIIILVLLMRLILHPIQKYSQVSMHRMSKLAPRAEEIKKKYASNKAEMNKKLMELYREQGASPIMGMLPMFIQMPIWIALWSAINTSIDLRGAPFLPFWITDLSAPDALISWTPFAIPFLGWHIGGINLLPILMGVAFYLQQKLMPAQASAPSNPQMAQQQKIMMIMLPLIMPLALYNAPSGVNLYIMASTFAGVIEGYVIKKHIREREEQEAKGVVPVTSKTGGKVKKKKPKPFFRF
jgi:YidC/Oxa1 family membrane protein insertase